MIKRGEEIYAQLCHTCHGKDAKGQPMAGGEEGDVLAPSLINTPRVLGNGQALVRILLDGMTGPIDGKSYPGMMMPMKTRDDQWVADVATYIRSNFGNRASSITPKFVTEVRGVTSSRTTPWTESELAAAEPPRLLNKKQWKVTASHNQNGCRSAVDDALKSRYTTKAVMEEGMWFQIQLPEPANLSAISIDSNPSNNDYARAFKVELSENGNSWQSVASAEGTSPLNEVSFPSTKAQFIRVTLTESLPKSVGSYYWSIHELNLFGQ